MTDDEKEKANEPGRVLMLIDWFAYYAAPFTVELSKEVNVFCILRDHGSELGISSPAVHQKTAMFRPVPVRFLKRKQIDPRCIPGLLSLIVMVRRFRPAAIHSQWHSDWRLLLLSLLAPGAVRILTVHDVKPHIGIQFHTHLFKRLVRRAVYASTDVFIVHGERLVLQLKKDPRVGGTAKIVAIPHGILAQPASLMPIPAEPRLLFFGRIEYYKGLDLLVEAVEEAGAVLGNLKLVIAGEGSEGVRARSLVRNAQYFEWREGFIPDNELPELFGSASAVVLPYREASQSGVIPLAFANGRPVIATDVGALGDAVEDNVNGLLVPAPTVHGLREAIIRLFTQPGLVASLADGAHRTASECLSPSAIAAKHKAVYSSAQRRRTTAH